MTTWEPVEGDKPPLFIRFYVTFLICLPDATHSVRYGIRTNRQSLQCRDQRCCFLCTVYRVDSSPGPQYHIDAKITRFGKDGTPAYSMLGRMKAQSKLLLLIIFSIILFALDTAWYAVSTVALNIRPLSTYGAVFCSLEELFQTPGPGAYIPERAPPCNLQHRPPSYTMGSRTFYRTTDSVPAPNKYSLPPLLGSHVPNKLASASYTISSTYSTRGSSVDLAKTPGPCRYNSTDPSVYLPRQPAFSMLGRHSLLRNATTTPGPGTYNPEKVTVHKAQAPAYSLGIRHSEFVTPLIVNISDWPSIASAKQIYNSSKKMSDRIQRERTFISTATNYYIS